MQNNVATSVPCLLDSWVASVLRQTLEVSRWQGSGDVGRARGRCCYPSQSQLTTEQARQAGIQPANQISIHPSIRLSFEPPNHPGPSVRSWCSSRLAKLLSISPAVAAHVCTCISSVYLFRFLDFRFVIRGTCKVEGYNKFVSNIYVIYIPNTYIFLFSLNSQVDIVFSVCVSNLYSET